jgi:hypothetical protein
LYCIDQNLGKAETFCKAAMIFNRSEVMGHVVEIITAWQNVSAFP